MSTGNQSYRKKQAFLVLLVFVCLGAAIWFHSAMIAVGAVLAICALCFWASTLEPEKTYHEHHH